MKEYTNPNDIIISQSYPQTAFYSERKTMPWSYLNDTKDFENYIMNNPVKFVMISVFETHPQWVYDIPKLYNNTLIPVNAYFLDGANKNIAAVVYAVR